MAIYKPPVGANIVDRNSGATVALGDGNTYYDLGAETGLGGNQYGPQIGDVVDTGGKTLIELNAGKATPTTDVFGNKIGDQAGAVAKAQSTAQSQGAVQTVAANPYANNPSYAPSSPNGPAGYIDHSQPQQNVQQNQTQQPVQQSQSSGYVNINGAYFKQTPSGLQIVNDQTILAGLKNGSIQSGSQNGLGTNQVQGLTNPQNVPQASQGGQGAGYINANGAYFQQGANGLQLVNDQNTLQGLRSGQIPSTQQGLGSSQLGGFTNPENIPSPAKTDQATQQQATVSQISKVSPQLGSVLSSSSGDSSHPLAVQAQTDPVSFVSDVYSKLYKDSGLATIKSQFEAFTKKIEDLTNEQNDKITDINNDPWLDEGTRQRNVQRIKDKYAGKIDSATHSATLLQGFYDKGNQQMQFLTQQAIGIYNNQVDFQNQVYRDAINNAATRENTLLKLQNDNANNDANRQIDLAKITAELSKPITVGENSSLYDPTTGQIIARGSGVGGGSGGLTAGQINTTVNQIASGFDNEPLVKNFNTINTAVKTFNSLGSSATDDIQRVYTFAKIADPTSAVKEGEYNSIEKYSQALLKRAGLNVSRVFNATGILTPEARLAMSKTIQSSLDSAKAGYDQTASEYQRQINDAYAGKPRQITNYQTGISKGSMTDSAFVEKALTSQSINYNSVINSTPAGKIAVLDNVSGQPGYVTPAEFTNSKYTKL